MSLICDLLTDSQCRLLLAAYDFPAHPEYHVEGLRGVVRMLVKNGDIKLDDVKNVLAHGELKYGPK